MFDIYEVNLTCHRLTAGLPASITKVAGWLKATQSEDYLQAHIERLERSGVDPANVDISIFNRNEDGQPTYESRCMIGALKEGANILKTFIGIDNLRSKLTERVFMVERDIVLTSPIGISELPIHVMTAQGPRNSMSLKEYVENQPMSFKLKVLQDPSPKGRVPATAVQTVLEYLQDGGIGSDRRNGSGTFTLESFTQIQ